MRAFFSPPSGDNIYRWGEEEVERQVDLLSKKMKEGKEYHQAKVDLAAITFPGGEEERKVPFPLPCLVDLSFSFLLHTFLQLTCEEKGKEGRRGTEIPCPNLLILLPQLKGGGRTQRAIIYARSFAASDFSYLFFSSLV